MKKAEKRKLLDKWKLEQILQNGIPCCRNCESRQSLRTQTSEQIRCARDLSFTIELSKRSQIINIYPQISNSRVAQKKFGFNRSWICEHFVWRKGK